jgi:hypothetical protein
MTLSDHGLFEGLRHKADQTEGEGHREAQKHGTSKT